MKVLTGKVAFLSGASRGIGRAIAEALAQAGADVAINCHTHIEEAEQVADTVRQAGRRALLCGDDIAQLPANESNKYQLVGSRCDERYAFR